MGISASALWTAAATGAASTAVSTIAGGLLGGKGGKAPAPQAVAPAPQAAKAPDVNTFKRNNVTNAATTGPSSTFLTGLGGVDPSMLNLGKSTYLGS